MRNLNVLVKVSESCPLSCIYCYEGDKSAARMDEKNLARMFEIVEARKNAETTHYTWHGAEPMTTGLDFYKKAVELQKPYISEKHTITNGMQSNGVLLTSEMADFFANEHFGIGFSLDGPKELHNKTRPYHNGSPSFDRVMQSIDMMRERVDHIRETRERRTNKKELKQNPGIIAVLTKLSLPYLDEMYDFFKETGLDFKINPIVKCGFASEHDELSLSLEERTEALTHLFDRWFFDSSEGNNVNYESMIYLASAIFAKKGNSCDMVRSCQYSFISIGSDGTVYPCARYSGEKISYGNINTVKDFSEIENSNLRQSLLRRYESNKECQSCEYNFMCYSGCMHNALIDGDIMKKDPSCASNKQVYEHVAKRILEQLRKDKAVEV